MQSRWQRKREKESLKEAVKYLTLAFVLLALIIKLGLPGLARLATFLGEIRSGKEPLEKKEQIPLMAPKLNSLPEATSSSELNLSGFAQSGATIILFVRGINVQEIMADKEGEFSFSQVHLAEGENELYVQAKDEQGGESEFSNSLIVVFDQTAPLLTVDSPNEGERFFDKDSPITVSGQTEVDASLTVNRRFVLVRSDGSWETSFSLSSGDNSIEVISQDQAGNQSKETLTVNYTP